MIDEYNTSSPSITGDTVYIGGWEELYAISTQTGEIEWIFYPEPGSEDGYYADPAVDAGTIYFGGGNHFYAVDSKTGQEKWKVKLSGWPRSVPTVYDGTVYIETINVDKVHDP